MFRPKRIYLAVPYTHESKDVMEHRYQIITGITANLVQRGYHIFSPITHNHVINVSLKEELKKDVSGFSYWKIYDLAMIGEWADEVWVVPLEGWNNSVGVNSEIEFALTIDKNVTIMSKLVKGDYTDCGPNTIEDNQPSHFWEFIK